MADEIFQKWLISEFVFGTRNFSNF